MGGSQISKKTKKQRKQNKTKKTTHKSQEVLVAKKIYNQHSGGRGRQISEFEASVVYRVNSRIARATQSNPVSKNKKRFIKPLHKVMVIRNNCCVQRFSYVWSCFVL